jgi:hypothetical protein
MIRSNRKTGERVENEKAEHYYNAHANMEAFIDFQRGIKLSELE